MKRFANHLSQQWRTKKYLYGKIVVQAGDIAFWAPRKANMQTDTLIQGAGDIVGTTTQAVFR
ncbi:hypothetical protein BIY29_01870 [Brenneria alni]|uniref:Uncharacterized protein n=1 Tax=Brenneria alni TaxID=71656 RepID=A0A421DTJ4_9GAMM|nr:hypothetical protein BIY29_01870 [Brenneria alni]